MFHLDLRQIFHVILGGFARFSRQSQAGTSLAKSPRSSNEPTCSH